MIKLATAVIVAVPWMCGLFFLGALAGLWLDVNPYITAVVLMGVGVIALVVLTDRLTRPVTSTDRPEQPEPDVLGGQPPAEPGKPGNG